MNILSFKAVSKGILLSLLFSMLALVILSVVTYFANVSDSTVSALIFAITVLSVLFGAFILAKNIECRGLLNGLALGVGYFVVLSVLSLAVHGCIGLSVHNLLRLLAILAAGMLGGVLGINN